MCGRFSLQGCIQQLPGYGLDIDEWVDEQEFVPRYNIAPRTQAPVIRRREAEISDSPLIVQTMKWGLIPHWSKFENKSLNTTNARSENLVERGGMWDTIKGKKRCLIPSQGYYEWLTKGKEKLPYFTKRKDGMLLLMAGLYDSVKLEGKVIWTFAIVTTDANKDFSWLHARQPVFLTNHEAIIKWLDTSTQSWNPELTKMVQPFSDASVTLECFAVPKEVGKVGTESPSFIEPITKRKDGIEAIFTKQKAKSAGASPGTGGKRRLPDTSFEEREIIKRSSRSSDLSSPPGKRLKRDHGDDSNQPKAEKEPYGGQSVSFLRKPSNTAPAKNKPVKHDASLNNKKISAFFKKA